MIVKPCYNGIAAVITDDEWDLIYIDCKGIIKCNSLPDDYNIDYRGCLIVAGVDLI